VVDKDVKRVDIVEASTYELCIKYRVLPSPCATLLHLKASVVHDYVLCHMHEPETVYMLSNIGQDLAHHDERIANVYAKLSVYHMTQKVTFVGGWSAFNPVLKEFSNIKVKFVNTENKLATFIHHHMFSLQIK
jgi:hypothetical protein